MKIVSDNPGQMYRIMTLFCDDRGKWLYTSFKDLEDVGMTPFNFTAFSRIDAGGMYLEEEMDAQIFTEAYEKQTGNRIVLNAIYEEPSPVRQKQSNLYQAAERIWKEKAAPIQRLRVVSGSRDTVDVPEERGPR